MAEKLKMFDFKNLSKKYDFDKWFDGSVWKLTRGSDYECQTRSMGVGLYKAAKQRDVRLKIREVDDCIVLQAEKKQ